MIETYGFVQLGAAIAVVVGAVTAVSARLPRLAILGLLVALLGGSSVTHAVPDPVAVAPGVVAGVLAGYLLWIAVRDAPAGTVRGTHLGWIAESSLATAAFAAGVGIALALLPDVDAVEAGVTAAVDRGAVAWGLGTAVALGILAAAPALLARDALRSGLGLLLLIAALRLARDVFAALGGGVPDPALDRAVSLALAVATAATAGAVAWVARRALHDGGDLELDARSVSVPRPSRIAAHLAVGRASAADHARAR